MASTSTGLPLRTPSSRPPELEDALNRFVYHPLAYRLALLLRPTGISPNAVSVVGMLFVWGAAAAYVGLAWPQSAAIGLLLHLCWHVVDGADGDLARLTGRSSPTGELVDGICDYAGHAPIYIGLAAMLQGDIGWWAWPLSAASAASHSAQTNHAETQRRYYLWWVYGRPWLKHAERAGHEVFRGGNWFSLTFGRIARGYLRLASLMTPYTAAIDAAVEAARGDPERRRRIADLVRRSSRRALTLQKMLGPNPRTIILGVSMALGSPLYFFLAEVVVLNLLLAASVRYHNEMGRRLARTLGRGDG